MDDTEILNELESRLKHPDGRRKLGRELNEMFPACHLDMTPHIHRIAFSFVKWIESKRLEKQSGGQ